MDTRRQELIQRAQKEFGSDISPCGPLQDFENCFTTYNGRLHFWFNTTDGDTRIVRETSQETVAS